MLNIKKGSPWLFWPDSICDTFPENPANKILTGENYFKLTLNFNLPKESNDQRTIFTIVPMFTGLDVYPDRCTLVITLEDSTEYISLPPLFKVKEDVELVLEHSPKEFIRVFINKELKYSFELNGRVFGITLSPHILLGSGNFPDKDFNLNYTDLNLNEFKLENSNTVLAHHLFKEFIFDKSVDLTGNCNFIHKL
jgi:hypothetical protein